MRKTTYSCSSLPSDLDLSYGQCPRTGSTFLSYPRLCAGPYCIVKERTPEYSLCTGTCTISEEQGDLALRVRARRSPGAAQLECPSLNPTSIQVLFVFHLSLSPRQPTSEMLRKCTNRTGAYWDRDRTQPPDSRELAPVHIFARARNAP